jgi:hypothetical protein
MGAHDGVLSSRRLPVLARERSETKKFADLEKVDTISCRGDGVRSSRFL